MFELHPRLAEDTVEVGRLPLSLVRLSLDANYPWVLLVPECEGVTELHLLRRGDRHQLSDESAAVAAAMQRVLGAHKMNVASLGNLVPQLHVHHVARFEGDPAWPGPIWGAVAARPYAPGALEERLSLLRTAFTPILGFSAPPA